MRIIHLAEQEIPAEGSYVLIEVAPNGNSVFTAVHKLGAAVAATSKQAGFRDMGSALEAGLDWASHRGIETLYVKFDMPGKDFIGFGTAKQK